MTRTIVRLLAVGAGFAVALSSLASAQVSILDLGMLPDSRYSVAGDINDDGQVVGMADLASGGSHAVLWAER